MMQPGMQMNASWWDKAVAVIDSEKVLTMKQESSPGPLYWELKRCLVGLLVKSGESNKPGCTLHKQAVLQLLRSSHRDFISKFGQSIELGLSR